MQYIEGASLPPLEITLLDADRTTPDLDGYTLTVRVGPSGGNATLELTDGLTYTDGILTVDTPDLATLPVGVYDLEVTATTSGRARKWLGMLRISRTLGEVPVTP